MSACSICAVLLLGGCEQEYSNDYAVGIIQTKEYRDQTKVCFYDEEMQETGEIKYSYPNIAFDGFRNSLSEDGILYLQPKGHGDKLDDGRILAVRLSDGEIEEYDIGRTNITGVAYADRTLYTASNLDTVCYVDIYDMETNQMKTVEITDYIVDSLVVGDGEIYGIARNLNDDTYLLCHISQTGQGSEILHKFEADMIPAYIEYYDESVFFVNNDVLYEYVTKGGQMVIHHLPHENAYNLLLQDEKLYIGCTDLFEDEASYIDVFDVRNKKVTQLLTVDNAIVQMEVSKEDKNIIYILDYEKLTKYRIKDEKSIKESETKLTTENDFYIGGFFLNE